MFGQQFLQYSFASKLTFAADLVLCGLLSARSLVLTLGTRTHYCGPGIVPSSDQLNGLVVLRDRE